MTTVGKMGKETRVPTLKENTEYFWQCEEGLQHLTYFFIFLLTSTHSQHFPRSYSL